MNDDDLIRLVKERVANDTGVRVPLSMLINPSRFDMDDDAAATAANLVDAYDDEYDW